MLSPNSTHLRTLPTNPFREFRGEEVERSVPARFEQMVREHAGRPAIKFEGRAYTYRELDDCANKIAGSIIRRGVTPHAAIAILVEQGFLHIASILGVLKSGCVFVALDPANPASRTGHILKDCGASLVLVEHGGQLSAAGLDVGAIPTFVEPEAIGSSAQTRDAVVPLLPSETACLIYTSGSSGAPKGSVVTHHYLLRHVLKVTNSLHVSHTDRLSLLSSAGISAAIGATLVGLMNGACVLPFAVQREGLRALAQWMRLEGITVYHSVPTLFRHFAESLPEGSLFPQLRLIWLSGEAVLRRHVDLYRSRFSGDVLLCNSLGSTEAGSLADYFINRETPVEGAVLPVGYEADGMRIIIVDENGSEVPYGQVGEISVRLRSKGYWQRPELTKSAFQGDSEGGDWRQFRTGDLGYMLPDRCLVHLGRKDSQVKVRGHRIELAEVETAVMDLPGVKESVVTAKKDAYGEPRLVAYLVLDDERVVSAPSLRRMLLQRLPDYMIPSRFVILEAIPLGPSGKVDLAGLPDPEWAEESDRNASLVSGGDIASRLSQLWSRMLGVKQVGLHDDFFDAGGDSLLATTMALEIEEQFDVRVPIAILFDSPTPARLAAAIAAGSIPNLGECLVPIQPSGNGPPLYCVHGCDGVVSHYRTLASHLGTDQPVYGVRPRGADGSHPVGHTLEEIAAHYVAEILVFQPRGPYLVCGYASFAFEVARQLCVAGYDVGLLALFDTGFPGFNEALPPIVRVIRHLGVAAGLPWPQRAAYLKDRAARLAGRPLQYSARRLFGDSGGSPCTNNAPKTIEAAIAVALSNYRPLPYPGHIVVFAAAEERSLFHKRDPRAGWRDLASGRATIRYVPGNHRTIMAEPNVRAIAEELADRIRTVRQA